jgi:hypothetical protein
MEKPPLICPRDEAFDHPKPKEMAKRPWENEHYIQ